MPAVRTASVAALCLLLFGCGSSEPRSPLILGKEGANALPGLRTLTTSQTQALKEAIESAGGVCSGVERTFLRRAGTDSESWDVRCSTSGFSVMIFADGSAAAVTPCFSRAIDGACSQPYRERRRSLQGSGPSGNLNPDLGKLLEPMTAKDGKAD